MTVIYSVKFHVLNCVFSKVENALVQSFHQIYERVRTKTIFYSSQSVLFAAENTISIEACLFFLFKLFLKQFIIQLVHTGQNVVYSM